MIRPFAAVLLSMLLAISTYAATFTVTTTTDAGAGSFRQAMLDANANPGLDTIQFNIVPGGPQVIAIAGGLPQLTDAVVIDGTTQPGFAGTPIVTIDGNNMLKGIRINSASPSTIRGLVIVDFATTGIEVVAGGATIVGNYIGVDASGLVADGNGHSGISVDEDVDGVVIGGPAIADRNVISANGGGGIYFHGTAGAATSDNNIVQGNIIGLDAAGLNDLGNGQNGISIDGGDFNQIGGTASGTGNIISGNGSFGIRISSLAGIVNKRARANVIEGNYIGTNINGTAAVPNGSHGILLVGPFDTRVGGTVLWARNIISGNGGNGIDLSGVSTPLDLLWATNTLIAGNYIGTDVTGAVDLGNTGSGVTLAGSKRTTIGLSAAGNVISGNGGDGITSTRAVDAQGAEPTMNSAITHNLIGTDVSGMISVPNARNGISMTSSQHAAIGSSGAGNLISGNAGNGVAFLEDPLAVPTAFNHVQGNRIGTDVTGTHAVPNGGSGVFFATSANPLNLRSNLVGGEPRQGNIIWFNTGDGIEVLGGVGNNFAGNSIDHNGGLGVDLAGEGVTPNDAMDPDAGPNNLQNYPVLAAVTVAGSTIVSGRLNSMPLGRFRIEFFSSPAADPSGFGEGRTSIGFTFVTTDPSGNASFSATLPEVTIGSFVTATATNVFSLDTSEFSNAAAAVNPVFIPTLSEWTLLLMAVILGLGGVLAMRR